MWIVLVLVVAALVVAAVVVVRRGAGAAQARIEASLADLDVQRQTKANFYGLATGGERQVRSLGTLALTPDELVFLQFVPAREVRVPRRSVSHVEIARSFLGKDHERDLLIVSWQDGNADGEGEGEERAAFDLPDPESWRGELRVAE